MEKKKFSMLRDGVYLAMEANEGWHEVEKLEQALSETREWAM